MIKCICVLGMHRSGTSCLTGIMQQLGVELGDVFTENPFNKKGNRESANIQALNNDVLEFNGGAWDKPVDVTRWGEDHCQRRDEIIEDISSRAKQYWGFKDPRTLLTLPFWLDSDAMASPLYIGTFRHPQRVALSLHQRGKMPLEKGWNLWLTYNSLLVKLLRESEFPILDFDLVEADYLEDVLHKLANMGLDSNAIGTDFFDPSLRNQTMVDVQDIQLPDDVNSLYVTLRKYSDSV